MPLKKSNHNLFYYEEDEYCNVCGYQEISLCNNYRVCTFCGSATNGPLPFSDLINLCVEEKGERDLANLLKVSLPTIKRWRENKNTPRPRVEQSIRIGLFKIMQ